jgi:hypothetical protein
MKLLNRITSTITTDTFEVEHEGKKITYIEYLNEKSRVIDQVLRDEDGNNIDDPTLLEEMESFVMILEQNQNKSK